MNKYTFLYEGHHNISEILCLKFCKSEKKSNLCGANKLNVLHHAKVLSNNKKAAYGCKSRDFSTCVELVSGDRLSFINPKTF